MTRPAAVLLLAALATCGCVTQRAPQRRSIRTDEAPAPIGPYSQAIEAAGVVYLAGQVGLDARTGRLVEGGVAAQTRQALEHLCAVLRAAGAGPQHVVQATVYLTDLADFAAMNAVFEQYLGDARPARATVQVAALPRGACVEIALIAVRTDE